MTDRATKALILAGSAPRPFVVPALGAEVLIRPLSASEAEEVQVAEASGIKASAAMSTGPAGPRPVGAARPRGTTDGTLDLNYADIVRGSHVANRLAMAYGLVEPTMSKSEVAAAPAEVVEQIGVEIRRISGLGEAMAAAIGDFRKEPGGPDDAGAPPVG